MLLKFDHVNKRDLFYGTQRIRLSKTIAEKFPGYVTRYEWTICIIKSLCHMLFGKMCVESGSSDNHLFRSMQNAFTEVSFTSEQDIR